MTPDIQSGDVVSLSFNGIRDAATTTLDIFANDAVQNGTTVTVTGHVGNDVVHDNVEQRIIEPALVDTVIGRAIARRSRATHAGSQGWLLVGARVRRR